MNPIDILNQYELMFEEFIVTKTDAEGTITFANDKFCKVSGYSREELIGQPHNIVRHPRVPKSVFKELWNNIQNGKPFQGIIRNLAKDGSEYIVDAKIFPINNFSGKIEYISIRTDITQYALNKEKEILNASEKLKIIINENGLIVDFNQKAQNIFKHLEISKTISESLFIYQEKDKSNNDKNNFITSLNSIIEDIINKNKFANIQNIKYQNKVFLLEAVKMSKDFILTFEDITDVEQMKEEHTHKLEESKDKMLVMFTHELKTPLNGIIGFSESLSKRLNRALTKEVKQRDIEKYITIIDDINALGNILYESVLSLLDSAKLKEGKYEINKTTFSLANQLEEPIKLFSRIYETIIEVDMNDFKILSDRNAINHIFINLFSNALKYGDSKVSVSTKIDDNKFKLIVEDNGKGIKEEDKSRIFNMFDQLDDQELTREAQGTGIGLYLVQQLCNVLGYDIEIEKSKSLGGACFIVSGRV